MSTKSILNFDHSIILDLNAQPVIEVLEKPKGRPSVLLTTDNVTHEFAPGTAIADQLQFTTPEQLQQRLQGARLFIKDGELLDYRYADYNGIIHSQSNIESMIKHIGVESNQRNVHGTLCSSRKEIGMSFLRDRLGESGDFNLQVNFAWSPFMTNLTSTMDLIRLICTNGMRATSELLQAKVPVMNRWEEHLAIASKQVENRAQGMFEARFKEMINQRASLSTVNEIRSHAEQRLKGDNVGFDQKAILTGIMDLTDVVRWSKGTITPEMLESVSSAHAPTMPTHLSQYTAWNMITELDSHIPAVDGSSSLALTRMANRAVFAPKASYAAQRTSSVGRFFNDARAALMFHQAA